MCGTDRAYFSGARGAWEGISECCGVIWICDIRPWIVTEVDRW